MPHNSSNASSLGSLLNRYLKPSATKAKQQSSVFKIDKEEFLKCKNDPIYFIKNYCYIIHPKRGTIKFVLYGYQEELLKCFVAHRCNAVLKSRQLGISTLIAGLLFWHMLFHQSFVGLVMANKENTAKNVLKKTRFMIKALEKEQKAKRCKNIMPWGWSKFLKRNVKNIQMPNHSEIIAEACTAEPGRSEGVSLMIVDEAAIVEDFADKWGGLGPIITEGGNCIMCSTPRGAAGKFYDTCINATLDQDFINKFAVKPTCSSSNINGFNLTILPYQIHPERDEKWLDEECKRLGYNDRQRAEEFYAEFLASGDTLVSPTLIQALAESAVDPIAKEGPAGNMWIWEEPIANCQYVIAADVADGGEDSSASHILKCESGEVVAEYKGHINTHEFAEMLQLYGYKYNIAGICVERSGPGIAVVENLVNNYKYPKIYYTPITDTLSNVRKNQKEQDHMPITYFYNPTYETYINGKPGFITTSLTRPQILNRMLLSVQESKIKPKSIRLIDEFKTFVYDVKKQRYQAAKGNHDDLVMSFAILAYVYEVAIKEFQLNQQYVISMLGCSSAGKRCLPNNIGSHNIVQDDTTSQIGGEQMPTMLDRFKRMKANYHKAHSVFNGRGMSSVEEEFGINK